jgi:hypothetical protein
MSSKALNPTRVLIAIALLLVAGAAFGQQQIVTPNPTNGAFAANGAPVSFTVVYTTNPSSPTTGFGVRMHWNSTELTFVSITNRFSTDSVAEGVPEADAGDLDGDASTDMRLNNAWTSLGGTWPAGPTNLYTANFTTTAAFDGSVVHFTASGTAAGYTFVPNDFTANGLPTPTPSNTPTISPTPSITPTPSDTPTPSTTPTPSNTPTASNTPTITPTPSITPTAQPIIAPKIPTLSGTGIALMVLLLLGIAVVYLVRQRN